MYYIVKATVAETALQHDPNVRVSEPVEAAQPRDAIRKADILATPTAPTGSATIKVYPLATDAFGEPMTHTFDEEQL